MCTIDHNNYNILNMNLINTCSRFAIKRLMTTSTRAFAGDSWKDRDEAAEKVFINRK